MENTHKMCIQDQANLSCITSFPSSRHDVQNRPNSHVNCNTPNANRRQDLPRMDESEKSSYNPRRGVVLSDPKTGSRGTPRTLPPKNSILTVSDRWFEGRKSGPSPAVPANLWDLVSARSVKSHKMTALMRLADADDETVTCEVFPRVGGAPLQPTDLETFQRIVEAPRQGWAGVPANVGTNILGVFEPPSPLSLTFGASKS